MRKIIVVTGQTATGKTSYALKLAHENGGELINADSRQIYKFLDIITGKDIPKNSNFIRRLADQFSIDNKYDIGYYTIDGVRLWLYDVVDPKQPFSSYDFKQCAITVIDDIVSRGKIPIIVGGSYLYIKHLLYGFETETIPPNWPLRDELNKKSVPELFDILRSINVEISRQMNTSDQKNPRRLIRKIEIAQHAKNPGLQGKTTSRVDCKEFIGFRFADNEKLAATIKKRVASRLEAGAIDEVASLLKRGYKKTDPGLLTLGYKQLIDYLESTLSKEEAIEKWITAELQYAKRQYAFMKKDKNISWIIK